MNGVKSKLLNDLGLMKDFMRLIATASGGGFRFSFMILVLVFVARSIANGFMIPYAISYIVSSFREKNGEAPY